MRRVKSEPKVISILGATGSVGQSSLDIVSSSPERYRINALSAHNSVEGLAQAALSCGAEFAAIGDVRAYSKLKEFLAGSDIEIAAGEDGLLEAASRNCDIVIGSIVGAAGIRPTMAALQAGNQVALANKEALVCAGDLIMAEAKRQRLRILPVDSEHNAIFQIFDETSIEEIEEVTITASGGPFRTWPQEEIEKATAVQALKHPNWDMGAKITIDSASMMNKGLEVIEAHHLYDVPQSKFNVVVHPQSIIHGMVSYSDGSVLAHLAAPDMRTPIAHCLAWPERAAANTKRLNLVELGQMTFEAPDPVRFPCLRLALEAMGEGGNLPNIMNAANEVAVAAFLKGEIAFGGIPKLVEAVMSKMAEQGRLPVSSLDLVLELDEMARIYARELLSELTILEV
ncbi:1-deoxy-D-xylulose-5-phosphate reductoisomerase [Cohaesibacter gelatinilyticus]|mgnify:CR=1 FL=1|uniref:1-deoxy-D-xylulose 5-phosphate reductoisomerase n=1 Tax=Cohaesibacter gelatinilyticus TaxID=372072 RepID=A0A285NED9_9HYPH|nr:1-deoxy-D-xylulose-5-phosphate reductoisomerase [Cohaesibacter gelatinilyticus]SNZ07862.1 1-deoxy-D-xylulose 5-phosphate reductoisomerase [Cohaesibacter gelatinilyticus]